MTTLRAFGYQPAICRGTSTTFTTAKFLYYHYSDSEACNESLIVYFQHTISVSFHSDMITGAKCGFHELIKSDSDITKDVGKKQGTADWAYPCQLVFQLKNLNQRTRSNKE